MKFSLMFLTVMFSAGAAAVTSDDLDNTFERLKQAEAQKDAAQVKKLATELCALTHQATSAPAPEGDAEKEAWKNRVAYARDLALHAEYALSAVAVQSPAAVTVDLLSTLERQNPKSKYLDATYASYFIALNQLGQASKIPAMAERAVANFPENDDLLLVLSDNAMNHKQSANALAYAKRLVTVLNKRAKPEGMAAADWERKRNAALGRGYWIAGMVLSEKTQYFEADQDLRAALPLVKGNDAMTAPTLYFLGLANFQLGKMTMNKVQVLEAAKFSQQAAAFAGPYQQSAWHNAMVMKDEAAKMR
jgi:tetratricopeptide (TPR) repeat protein